MQFLHEAAQAISRVCVIPSAHAYRMAGELDDGTREEIHRLGEACKGKVQALIDAHIATRTPEAVPGPMPPGS